MKLIHLADLHIGKRLNEFSLIDDQKYILREILSIIDEEEPEGVIIAGDVYDKTMPSDEATRLLDSFLTSLANRGLQVYMIAGNHDSAARLSFGASLIEASGVHIAPEYKGEIMKYSLGCADIHLLPFVKPVNVRQHFPDAEIVDYTDAVRTALGAADIDESRVNILVAHQFVAGASRSDSEEVSVGGLDNVEADVFNGFDYVALGHIHRPQKIVKDTIRYAGTPLKYSFSEAGHHKSVTVIEINSKDDINIYERDLTPWRDLRIIRGSYEELMDKSYYEGTNTEDYIEAVLTDEEDIPNALAKMRVIYPNIMHLRYDNRRTSENRELEPIENVENRSPLEIFEEFYEAQNNQPMSRQQRELVNSLIENIWEG